MSILTVTEETKGKLNWKVKLMEKPRYIQPSIISDPINKIHQIFPGENEFFNMPLAFLHEYIHAYLCEKYSNLFAGAAYENEYSDCFTSIETVLQMSCDWFVDAYLFNLCKDEFTDFLMLLSRCIESYDYSQPKTIETILSHALAVASAKKHLNIDVKTTYRIKEISKVFLNTSTNPELDVLCELSNKLISYFSDLRVKYETVGDYEIWKIV